MVHIDFSLDLHNPNFAMLVCEDKKYVGTPASCFKDFLRDLHRASQGSDEDRTQNTLRRRYTIIDHEDANTMEVGTSYVLSPAKNMADLAALHTIAENTPPEFASQIRDLIDLITEHPNRTLGSFGEACLPHITHPKIVEHAQQRLTEDRGK